MKVLLITVAGLSSRFSESLGKSCIKCLYYKEKIEESLLYQLLHHGVEFDNYIIVGGYKFDELKRELDNNFSDLSDRIILIENKKYAEYGSGYSLYLGLKAAENIPYDELVFAEGDLYLDDKSFVRICKSQKNVITCNSEAIWANKAVVFYYDKQNQVHYLYDTAHSELEIKEPFIGIFNSGQVWKFHNKELVETSVNDISEIEWQGTNLAFIQRYFGGLMSDEYESILFETWINCNTVDDFNKTLAR